MRHKLVTPLVFTSFLVIFFAFFNLLQNETIYSKSLGLLTKTYDKFEGNITFDRSSITGLTNKKFINWDGEHFKQIRDLGYDISKVNTPYIYAFFPLFPAVWKLSQLPPIGVLFLNFLFFCAGFLLLIKAFKVPKNLHLTYSLLALCIPSFIVFMLPYSEALFLFLISAGVYGFMKNKRWLFFCCFLLASATRPAYTVLLISIVCTEGLFLLIHKNITLFLKELSFKSLPIVIGTGVVGIIQQLYSPGPPYFKFFQAYDYWKREFKIPFQLVDWSHEGFGMSIPAIFIICLPLLAILIHLTIQAARGTANENEKIEPLLVYSNKNFIIVLSMTYLVGTFFINFFFQNGSINGLSRYVYNSPFLFVLLLSFYSLKGSQSSMLRIYFFTLALISLYVETVASYSHQWNFTDTGCIIGVLFLLLLLFVKNKDLKSYKTILYSLVFLNIIWSIFLLHSYLIEGWIFT